MVLTSPKCWGLCCDGTAPSQTTSPSLFQYRASAALHDPFTPLKPVPPQWLFTKLNFPVWDTIPAASGTQRLYADSLETLPRRFLSQWCWLITANFLALTSWQHQLYRKSKLFSFYGSDLLLITASRSALHNQNHRFLIQDMQHPW